MSYKYVNPNSWIDPALARAALAECEELLRQSQDRIAALEAELDEIRLTSMSDAIINIAIAALHGRITLETIVVKCPECCCHYVAGSDHASVCPDRKMETSWNHERDCGLTNDEGTCECPQPKTKGEQNG
jgi:hypothetical protein